LPPNARSNAQFPQKNGEFTPFGRCDGMLRFASVASGQMLSGYGYYKIRARGYYRFNRYGDTWTGFFET
jgi:hypothetical protein